MYRVVQVEGKSFDDSGSHKAVQKSESDEQKQLTAAKDSYDELEKRLTALFESRASKEIFLRADRDAPYGVVVRGMAAARRAGSDKIGIVTEAER